MSEKYDHLIRQLLPRGDIWRRRPGSVFDAVWFAVSEEAQRIESRINQVIEESDPRTSTEELERWFSDYDIPSECIKAFIDDPSRELLRKELLAKITSNSGLTKAFFEGLGRSLGYDTTVDIHTPFNVATPVNQPIVGLEWARVFNMVLRVKDKAGYAPFTVLSAVNEPLTSWGNALLQCVVRSMAPAHTEVIFIYEDTNVDDED